LSNLHIANIRKSFGSTEVLKGISLDIAEREFVALLGPSGCGKTTLLRTIAGLELQDSGTIDIDGRRIDDLGPAERDIALVFQSYALYPHLSVRQNISLPLAMRRLNAVQRLPGAKKVSSGVRKTQKSIAADVDAIARSMEIGHLLDRKPSQLSGGQKQRVAVARALVRKPSVLLMDEPLSNLDAKLRVQMRREIVGMHKRHGATTVYVTHDQTEAMTMADRIAVILNGELQQIGTPSEIYRSPATITVAEFVGSPKINVLACAVMAEGILSLGQMLRGHSGLAAGTTGSVGIRPEHVSLRANDGNGLPCRIANLEYLGSEILIAAEVADKTQVGLRMDVEAFERIGNRDNLAIDLPTRHALLFDDEGRRAEWRPA